MTADRSLEPFGSAYPLEVEGAVRCHISRRSAKSLGARGFWKHEESSARREAGLWQGIAEGLELRLVHFDEVPRLGEAAGLDIGDILPERSNALLLEAAIFG